MNEKHRDPPFSPSPGQPRLRFPRIIGLLPTTKRLLLIVWPFLAIVVLLVVLALIMVDVLSAGRAYVEGESRWSKGQKQGVFHLLRYAETKSDIEYQRYREAISVPVELGKARVEMEKPHPDYELAWQHFLDGGDNPDDINGVIRLYRYFRHIPYIDKVINIWAIGDVHIADLVQAADDLNVHIKTGDTSPARLQPIVQRIRQINDTLTPMENEFSSTLGRIAQPNSSF